MRIHSGLLLAVLLLLPGAGCTVVQSADDPRETAISFDPVLYVATKSQASGEYPAGLPFGVSAWQYPAGGSWTGPSAQPFFSESRVSLQDAAWLPVPRAFWPARQLLAFLAYAPYGAASGIDSENGVRFEHIDVRLRQTDLLFTEPIYDLTAGSCGGVVSFAFRHALCSAAFYLRSGVSEGEDLSVLGLELDGLSCTGSFCSLPQPQWVTEGSADTLPILADSLPLGQDWTKAGESMWMIPQFVQARIKLRLQRRGSMGTSEETLFSDRLNLVLEPGRLYSFSITYLPESGSLKVTLLDNLL